MDKRKLFIRVTILILIIFSMNFVANFFHWYSSLWWFDMVMHFLGGFWLALILLWMLPVNKIESRHILPIIFSVLLIGLGWEWFEIFVNHKIASNPLDLNDIASDIFFDLSGASLSFIYFFTRIVRIA